MRIAVCDDSALDRDMICELLRAGAAEIQLRAELVPYASGVELLYDVQDGTGFDIIFLDIYMTDHLGIDIAHRLRAEGYEGEIVFITASSSFAIDGYDVGAAGYILKPISLEKLTTILRRITRNFDERTYAVRQRANVLRIPLNEILYVESSNTKCILHRTGGSDYTIYKRLDEIEHELSDRRFLRSHQSYLVNMDYIQKADKQFHLTSGDVVLIRQRDLKSIRDAYLRYAEENGKTPAESAP